MRGLLVLVAITGFSLWWGGHHLRIALRNREPVEITCADYVKHPPDAEWLRLTRCEADFDHIAYEQDQSSKRVSKVYIPMKPQGSSDGTLATIVVERDDAEMLELATALEAADAHNRKIGDVTVQRVLNAVAGPDEGVIELGLALSDKDRDQLKGLGLGLATDFAILERGEKPRPIAFALGALGLGIALLGLFLTKLVRRFGSKRIPAV